MNDLMFTGQRVKWIMDEKAKKKSHITVEQPLCVSELTEVVVPKGLKDEDNCDKDLHTAYRSLLGSINWLKSRTQFQSCYQFSRCTSAAAPPTIGDCKALNKLCRQIVGDPMELMFWPLQGDPRLIPNSPETNMFHFVLAADNAPDRTHRYIEIGLLPHRSNRRYSLN